MDRRDRPLHLGLGPQAGRDLLHERAAEIVDELPGRLEQKLLPAAVLCGEARLVEGWQPREEP
jgi:hypothetical protein